MLVSSFLADQSHELLCNIASPPLFVGMTPARIEYIPPEQSAMEPCSLVVMGSMPLVAVCLLVQTTQGGQGFVLHGL